MARKKRRFLGSLFLLALGAAVGWWIARHGLPRLKPAVLPAQPAAAGDIRRVDFRNFTYQASCATEDGTLVDIRVRDGEFRREDKYNALSFSVFSVSYGDLTGDGHAEAAIATNCNTGGTGQFSEGMVFSMQGGQPVLLARVPGGDRAYGGIALLAIDKRQLIVERYATDDGGPLCCPKYIDTTRLRWDGAGLAQAGGVSRRAAPAE
jgi:hypothetical protein